MDQPQTTNGPVQPETSNEPDQQTYENNKYYDIVEEAVFKDSIDYSHIVHKVLAKQGKA